MIVVAGFYESITARDTQLFLRVLWKSAIIVSCVALMKVRSKRNKYSGSLVVSSEGTDTPMLGCAVADVQALKLFATESLGLQFRQRLVNHIHARYFKDDVAHRILCGEMDWDVRQRIFPQPSGMTAANTCPSCHAMLAAGSGGGSQAVVLDNPDQRATSDVDLFSSSLAAILGAVITTPGLIVYCASQQLTLDANV